MKLIIAGGRDFHPEPKHTFWLNELHSQLESEGMTILTVISGCAQGADAFGEKWAHENQFGVARFRANWDKHGKSAGPKRNRAMAESADAVVLFHGGRGTQNMYETAMDLGLKIFDWRQRE